MIQVNKAEKAALLTEFPDMKFVRTMKHDSKRGHYYCVESKQVVKFLERYHAERRIYRGRREKVRR